MKVYVINLDRHPERLAHMRDQLSDVGFERVAATDGAENPEAMKGLTRFELACLESHRSAWQLFLKRSEPYACFLEDDVHFSPDFGALVKTDDWIPPDAHSIKLDTYLQEVKLGERRPVTGRREIAQLYTRHESSAAYILSHEGAQRYLGLTARAVLPADYSLFPRSPRKLGLRVYQLSPAVAVQDHLLRQNGDGQAFLTAMAEGEARRSRTLAGKLWRETTRLLGQIADVPEAVYLRASARLETTTIEFG